MDSFGGKFVVRGVVRVTAGIAGIPHGHIESIGGELIQNSKFKIQNLESRTLNLEP
jgi:hypothetical protein